MNNELQMVVLLFLHNGMSAEVLLEGSVWQMNEKLISSY
jgi:hypothetical protein